MSFHPIGVEKFIFLNYDNTIKRKEEVGMERNKISEKVAKQVSKTLNSVLKVEANSTSCVVVYQPKAPKQLDKFRRK